MKRSLKDGQVSVTGPEYEWDGLPNVGVGISAALTAASKTRRGTYYVRDGERMHAHVSVDDDVIRVLPVKRETTCTRAGGSCRCPMSASGCTRRRSRE